MVVANFFPKVLKVKVKGQRSTQQKWIGHIYILTIFDMKMFEYSSYEAENKSQYLTPK